jgi:hypothetical protein
MRARQHSRVVASPAPTTFAVLAEAAGDSTEAVRLYAEAAEEPLREARELFASLGYKPALAECETLLGENEAAAVYASPASQISDPRPLPTVRGRRLRRLRDRPWLRGREGPSSRYRRAR